MASDGSVVIEITGDASELISAIKNAAKSADVLNEALQSVATAFQGAANAAADIESGGLDSATQSADNLDGSLDETARSAGKLDDALDDTDSGGLDETKMAADRLGDALDDAGESALSFVDIFKGTFLADLASKGFDLATEAIKSLASSIVDLAKTSLDNYSSFQQLTGGVETLFGTSANVVKSYADTAYKTAGMSANAYMETVTSFSASLIQGLGGDTAEAARIADMAITDMSDNANKMGTAMSSIQDAYQGFAKQNYTMLDNLKLGYGGTQEEMIRLINDSGVLNEKISSLDGISFDTIIAAIHAVQDQLGITGTTAEEASGTIEGSINSAKAAWENLLTGMANPDADLGALMQEFVASFNTAFDNILPQVVNIFQNLGPVISGVLPKIAENLPGIVTAATSIIQGLADGLVAAAPVLAEQAPTIIEALVKMLIATAIAAVDVGAAIIEAIATGIYNTAASLASAASEIGGIVVNQLADEFSNIGAAISEPLSGAASAINDWGSNVVSAISSAVSSAVNAVGSWFSQIPGRISGALSSALSTLKSWGSQMVSNAKSAMSNVVSNIASTLRTAISRVTNIGRQIIQGLINGIKAKASAVVSALKGVIDSAINKAKSFLGIASPSKVFFAFGRFVSLGFANGITAGVKYVVKATKTVATAAEEQITKLNAEIEAIEAAAQKRQEEKELAEYKKNLAEKYDKLGKAELKERAKIQEEIDKLEADWAEKQLQAQEKAQKEALQSRINALEDIQDAYQDAMDEVVSARDSMKDKLSDFELFNNDDGDLYLWDIQKMIDQIQAYGDAMTALKDRGIADSLFQKIVEMDREEAILYAKKLLELGDAQYDAYMNLWRQKEAASEQVAKSLYQSEVDAIEEEYAGKLPDALGKVADDAMSTFADRMATAGEAAVNTAKNIADRVLAELERVNAAQRLTAAVGMSTSSFSASLGSKAQNDAEARTVARRASATETAMATAFMQTGKATRDVVLQVNGKEFARATLDDYRSVEDQSPRIVSD